MEPFTSVPLQTISSNYLQPQFNTTFTTSSFDDGKSKLDSGNYKAALRILEPEAEKIPLNPIAAAYVGWIYGNGVFPLDDKTKRKSQDFYEKAYVKKDEIFKCDDADAQYVLGLVYVFCGKATLQERKLGVELLVCASGKKNCGALRELGLLYLVGDVIEADVGKAVECFVSAADGGDIRGMYHLGVCYSCGFGVAKNQELAVKWYRKAAEKGDVLAQISLGNCYEYGIGVSQPDNVAAVMYYGKAAEQGNVTAQHNLAVMYENDRPGLTKDYNKALKFYQLAAAQNFPRSQNNLAKFYEEGRCGLKQDYTQAFLLYKASAMQNYTRAQYNLGCYYEYGTGTTIDLKSAQHYYQLAADANNEQISPLARERLYIVKNKLSEMEIPTTFNQALSNYL
jgi:TPR repeat protein